MGRAVCDVTKCQQDLFGSRLDQITSMKHVSVKLA
jgi:hypothetical protein